MEPFAILLGVISSIDTLRKVIDTIQGASQFNEICADIGSKAAILLAVIDADNIEGGANTHLSSENLPLTIANQPPAAQNSVEHVKKTIREIQTLILRRTQSPFQKAWEIFMNGKLARSRQQLSEWIIVCMMEYTVKNGNDFRNFSRNGLQKLNDTNSNLQTLLTKSEVIVREQRKNFQRLEEQLAKLRQNEDGVVAVQIAFPYGNPRLNVTGNLEQSEDCTATLQDVGRVICKMIKGDEVRNGWGSRHVENYQCISKGTLVQSFYGIAEFNGKLFAVMEDLRNNPTVAATIESNDQYEPLACIRFAYELANAVAYLHSVGIIIKNLSDTNVVVVRMEGGSRIQPRLMNLEQARRLVDATAFEKHDVRFEAPEYRKKRKHSKYTDVWSLGVLIWEWLTRTFPFATPPGTLLEKQDTICERLAKGDRPWAYGTQGQGAQDIETIVQGCWSKKPELRSPAAYVEQLLLDLYARRSVEDFSSPMAVSEEVKQTVHNTIRAKMTSKPVDDLSRDHVLALYNAVKAYNDPVSSCLLGAAIWWELVPLDALNAEIESTESLSPALSLEVKRARVALQFLEIGVDAGLDLALLETSQVYRFLSKHYGNVLQ